MIARVNIPPEVDQPDIIALVRQKKPQAVLLSSQDNLCRGRLISMQVQHWWPRGRYTLVSHQSGYGNPRHNIIITTTTLPHGIPDLCRVRIYPSSVVTV